ncbi:sugar nucleotide-binding protein [Pseudomonadota bacterium]
MNKKVCILGCTGMLGSAVLDVFVKNDSNHITATARSSDLFNNSFSSIQWKIFDAEKKNLKNTLSEIVKDVDFVVNCIGIIKPYMQDSNPENIKRAIKVNSMFPYSLSDLSKEFNFKVLQIATDCVYSGQKGLYCEDDKHDALDVYDKTKSLGEVIGNSSFYNLRCSIIGKEKKSFVSLLEWFLKQPRGATLNGYANHHWNGVTAHHFGKICLGIIKNDLQVGEKQHIVPGDIVSKYDMLKIFAKYFNRSDLIINKVDTPIKIDRTIYTINKAINNKIWESAGYLIPPTIEEMIKEISEIS